MPPMRRRDLLARSASAAMACLAFAAGGPARANSGAAATPGAGATRVGLSLIALSARRDDDGVVLNYDVLIDLSDDLKDALERGISVVFVVEAAMYRRRWYWTDQAVSRAARRWRLTHQPLTRQWRLSIGAFTRQYPSLEEALDTLRRSPRWRVADRPRGDADDHYLEFSFRLDTDELPRPLQIGLGGRANWNLELERQVLLSD